MMEQSRRARRMDRHHKKHKHPVLNLVSLMDIFTILVFFLLVNSSNTQQLPNKKDLKLPTSIATKVPKETVVIAITPSQILVQGQKIADIQSELGKTDKIIDSLKDELSFHAQKSSVSNAAINFRGRPVTIMGDENIPYELLRKVMATCREANYTQIAFATVQQAKQKM
jgi:biopolymer transport protein ExbD